MQNSSKQPPKLASHTALGTIGNRNVYPRIKLDKHSPAKLKSAREGLGFPCKREDQDHRTTDFREKR